MNKRTIIVGSAGQDGRILFDRLSREGRFVVGIDREGVDCTETIDLPPVEYPGRRVGRTADRGDFA